MTDIKILYDTEELIMMLWLVLKFYALKTKKKTLNNFKCYMWI